MDSSLKLHSYNDKTYAELAQYLRHRPSLYNQLSHDSINTLYFSRAYLTNTRAMAEPVANMHIGNMPLCCMHPESTIVFVEVAICNGVSTVDC